MNQRRRTRVQSRKSASVAHSGGECRGEVVNVSLKGCLIGLLEGELPRADEEISLSIHLEAGAPELDVVVDGRVVRLDATSLAVDITEVPPESFGRLFRLVQYNAPDPDEIEDELTSSAFLPESGTGT